MHDAEEYHQTVCEYEASSGADNMKPALKRTQGRVRHAAQLGDVKTDFAKFFHIGSLGKLG